MRNELIINKLWGGVLRRMQNRQKRTFLAAKKYAAIGVPVLSFDTDQTSPEEIAETIINHLRL